MDALLIYIDDWDSSKKIAMMDAHEELGYFHLLKAAAKQEDCGLPDDDTQLAILSKLGAQWKRVTKDTSKRISDHQEPVKTSGRKLRECFFSGGTADPKTGQITGCPGRLYNSRLLKAHRQYLASVDQKRKAATARWRGRPKIAASENGNPDASAHADAHPAAMRTQCGNACRNDLIPISISNTTTPMTNSPGTNGYDPGSGWSWFQAEYPKHRLNPHMDGQLWLSVVHSPEIEQMIREKLPQFKRSAEWRNDGGQMVPSAAKFLGERRFLMEPLPPAEDSAELSAGPLREETEVERKQREDEMRARLRASMASA
jgi:hypothetical protein